MAYKFQRGPAKLSGSLVQEGSIAVHDESGNSNASISQAGAADFASTLTVAGASDLNGALDVAGAVDLAASGVQTDIRGTLSVDEAAVFDSTLSATGIISGSAAIKGLTLDINGAADVEGAANLQSTLAVAGASTLAGASFSGAIDANSTADFQGDVNLQAALAVAGASTLAGASFSGAIDANSTSDFEGAMNLQAGITIAGASDLNGALDVAGAVDLAATTVLTNIRGTLSVDEAAVFDAAVQIDGAIDANSTSNFQGAMVLQSTLSATGIISGSAALQIGGASTFAGNLLPLSDDGVDLGETGAEFKDLYIDGVAYIDSLQADELGAPLDANNQAITNINVDSGAIDGTAIGANAQSTAKFSTISGSSTLAVGGASTFAGHALPDVDSLYDLGSDTKRWRNIYADNIYGDFSRDVAIMATTSVISASTDVVVATNAAAATFTLPSMNGGVVASGKSIVIKRSGLAGAGALGNVTIAVASGDSFDDDEPIILETAGASVTCICHLDTWFVY